MKKRVVNIIIYSLAFVVTAVNMFYVIRGSVFSDINDLPSGKLINTVSSPDGKTNLNIYLVNISFGNGIRGEVDFGGKKTNVFWQTDVDSVNASWVNNRVVTINDVLIDAYDGGTYDSRRGKSLFQEGALEGKEKLNEEK